MDGAVSPQSRESATAPTPRDQGLSRRPPNDTLVLDPDGYRGHRAPGETRVRTVLGRDGETVGIVSVQW